MMMRRQCARESKHIYIYTKYYAVGYLLVFHEAKTQIDFARPYSLFFGKFLEQSKQKVSSSAVN